MMRISATAILAAVLLAVSANASAQSTTFLSNLSNTTDGGYGGTPDSADHIQTGNAQLVIGEIQVLWESVGATPGINQVLIYEDNGGFPGTTTVGTPFTNASVTTTGVVSYSGQATLQPNTVYWVVVDITDDSEVAYTFDATFTAAPETDGAVLLDRSAYGDNQAGSWSDDPANLQFALLGNAGAVVGVPTLTSWGLVILVLAMISFVGIRRFH